MEGFLKSSQQKSTNARTPGPLLPSTFSRSLMCCRLQPVSSRLRSDSCWDESSLVWTFLRSFGLPETQQEAVFPISALLSASGPEEGGSWNQPLEPTAHPTPPRRSRRSQRCPERMTRVGVAASSLGLTGLSVSTGRQRGRLPGWTVSLPPVGQSLCAGPCWIRYG